MTVLSSDKVCSTHSFENTTSLRRSLPSSGHIHMHYASGNLTMREILQGY